jgi:predicted RNase H-like nuclease
LGGRESARREAPIKIQHAAENRPKTQGEEMKEPIQHILWSVESRLREIERLAVLPEDTRGQIIRETNGALADLRDAEFQLRQLREARRAPFEPEVSP